VQRKNQKTGKGNAGLNMTKQSEGGGRGGSNKKGEPSTGGKRSHKTSRGWGA